MPPIYVLSHICRVNAHLLDIINDSSFSLPRAVVEKLFSSHIMTLRTSDFSVCRGITLKALAKTIRGPSALALVSVLVKELRIGHTALLGERSGDTLTQGA